MRMVSVAMKGRGRWRPEGLSVLLRVEKLVEVEHGPWSWLTFQSLLTTAGIWAYLLAVDSHLW